MERIGRSRCVAHHAGGCIVLTGGGAGGFTGGHLVKNLELYAERMALTFGRHYGMQVRIARWQNCYGPEGTWNGGRERRPELVEGKAPAAICRKVAQVENDGIIEVWGDGSGQEPAR